MKIIEVKNKIELYADFASKSAQEKITKAGGSINLKKV